MQEKTGYKYSIKFNQSLSTGMIAFEGYMAFDTVKEYDTYMKGALVAMLKEQQDIFTHEGFKCAYIIPNNLRQLANDNGKDAASKKLGIKTDKEESTK